MLEAYRAYDRFLARLRRRAPEARLLIATGLHMNPDEVRQRIRRFTSVPRYQPIFLKEDITPDEQAFTTSS